MLTAVLLVVSFLSYWSVSRRARNQAGQVFQTAHSRALGVSKKDTLQSVKDPKCFSR